MKNKNNINLEKAKGLEKAKEIDKKIESLKRKTNGIEFITGAAVGFPVGVYIGTGRTNENEYQIMPIDEFAAGVEDFWDWHVEKNEQWFESPIEAAADFVEKYQSFLAKQK